MGGNFYALDTVSASDCGVRRSARNRGRRYRERRTKSCGCDRLYVDPLADGSCDRKNRDPGPQRRVREPMTRECSTKRPASCQNLIPISWSCASARAVWSASSRRQTSSDKSGNATAKAVLPGSIRSSGVMSRDVVCCGPTESLQDVWLAMKESGPQRLPLVDQFRKPIGIISMHGTLLRICSAKSRTKNLCFATM
jgi:hypothetical protein